MKVTEISSQDIDPTENLIIGASDDPLWEECKGDIGSVMMYDKWLTPDEIKQNCNAQEGRYTASDDICEDF